MNNFGPNGYGICGRLYVEILHRLGYKTRITPYPMMDPKDPLFFLTKTEVENPLRIMHVIPTMPAEAFYTVTEVRKPPDHMAYPLQQAKLIMTQSRFCKESFSRITDHKKIHIVNFPFILEMFNPHGTTYKLKMKKQYKFKFFTVARVDVRKNLKPLMEAFRDEFGNDKDVCLIMKLGSDRYNIPKMFYELNLPKNILWMRDFVPDTSQLYRGMDAYITTDCGEGWGAPTTEAMLCGIPTIAPNHSGHLDYMNDKNSYLIDVGDWEHIGYRRDNLYQDLLSPQLEWKVPKIEDVRKKMRLCYEEYKDLTKEERIETTMIKESQKIRDIVSPEYVGEQLKTALNWFEGEYR